MPSSRPVTLLQECAGAFDGRLKHAAGLEDSGEMQQAMRLQAHQLDPEYVNRGETLRAAATKGAPRTRALPLLARETDSVYARLRS